MSFSFIWLNYNNVQTAVFWTPSDKKLQKGDLHIAHLINHIMSDDEYYCSDKKDRDGDANTDFDLFGFQYCWTEKKELDIIKKTYEAI